MSSGERSAAALNTVPPPSPVARHSWRRRHPLIRLPPAATFSLEGRRIALALALLISTPTLALQPDEILPDPALEQRARAISSGLRCLVCQNQSIDESDAPLAKDLRVLVRERLKAGDTDAAVQSFVVQRYGDFVLLRPPLKAQTLLLWLSPLVVLAFGAGGLALASRRRRAGTAALSPAEQARLDALLEPSSKARAGAD